MSAPRDQADKTHVVGVDLGGTRLRVALADLTGNIVRTQAGLTLADEGQDAVVDRIVGQILAVIGVLPPTMVKSVAVAVPAPVDPRKGMVYSPPNLAGWGTVPLQAILEAMLRLPVQLGNDANLAALAEYQYGAGQGRSSLVYLTVSTGVGGGVVESGQLLLGSWGGAAEIGHMTIDMNGPRCSCGNHGCLEAMASGTAIAREMNRRLVRGSPVSEPGHRSMEPEGWTAEEVVRAAQTGDPLAREVVEWAGYNLGVGLTNVLHLFDPAVVVIGGGVSNAWDLLERPMRAAIQERAMVAYARRAEIVKSNLGDEVGLLGAVALALRSPMAQAP